MVYGTCWLEPTTLKQFSSKHKRRNRRSRSDRGDDEGDETAQDVVEEEVVGDAPFAA